RQARRQHSQVSQIQIRKIFQNTIDWIRATVDDDHLVGKSRLRFQAGEQALQLSRTIHGWNDDGDFGAERVGWLHTSDFVRPRTRQDDIERGSLEQIRSSYALRVPATPAVPSRSWHGREQRPRQAG